MNELVRAVKDTPQYLTGLVIATISAILSNPPVTLLTIASGCAMVVMNTWLVLAISLVIYILVYMMNSIAGAIGYGLGSLSRSVSTTHQHPVD